MRVCVCQECFCLAGDTCSCSPRTRVVKLAGLSDGETARAEHHDFLRARELRRYSRGRNCGITSQSTAAKTSTVLVGWCALSFFFFFFFFFFVCLFVFPFCFCEGWVLGRQAAALLCANSLRDVSAFVMSSMSETVFLSLLAWMNTSNSSSKSCSEEERQRGRDRGRE